VEHDSCFISIEALYLLIYTTPYDGSVGVHIYHGFATVSAMHATSSSRCTPPSPPPHPPPHAIDAAIIGSAPAVPHSILSTIVLPCPARVCLIIPAHPEPCAPPELRHAIPSFPPEPRRSVREEEEDGLEPVLICLGTLAVVNYRCRKLKTFMIGNIIIS
jgi:hypothetical protein